MAERRTDDRATRLLVKAVRSLPKRDQDALLGSLLSMALAREQAPQPFTIPLAGPDPGELPGLEAPSGDPTFTEALPPPGADVITYAGTRQFPAPVAGMRLQMVPLRLAEPHYRQLKEWCQEHDLSMAVVMRGLVERFLEETAGRAAGPKGGARASRAKRAGATGRQAPARRAAPTRKRSRSTTTR